MQTIQIQLLGGFRLLYDDQHIMMAQHVRLQSLLAYLVVHRDAPQARQHLAFLFWPDASEAQARANLRKALHELRRLLPFLDHFVQIEEQFLQWRNSPVATVDVVLFTTSLAQAEQASQPEMVQTALDQAVALYRGVLLPGCYDDWLLLERERLRQQYVKALEQLIGLLEKQRELAAALSYAQRLLQADALHESSYRRLMRLHLLHGDRATALRIYHTCVTVLQQELGVEPSPETQQLYQRLLNAATAPVEKLDSMAPAAQGLLPLVGRQPEWQTLQTAWRAAVAGAAQCVLIAGEAGIGKTRLAEELLQWTERLGYGTARTRAYAAEGRLAYAPLIDWLRADAIRLRMPELEPLWLVEVARLLPELLVARPDLPPPAPLADSWQRQRFREALVHALLLGRQPLLLVIDDLQWCDGETLEWLRYFLRQSAQEQLLVVGTVRPEEVGSDHPLTTLMLDLRQTGQLTEIELGSLTGDETAALATQVVGRALDQDQATALYTQTEGHPLFVVEMLRASEKEGKLFQLAAPPVSVGLPPRVQAVIESRLAQLSPPARDLAGLAAAVGRAFSIQVLAQASDGGDDALVRGLDELWRRGIVREQGIHRYDFSHDRLREVTYAKLGPAQRVMLHRRVAHALAGEHAEDIDAVSAQLAMHYAQAGEPEQAIGYYQRAARVAKERFAYAETVEHLTKALTLLGYLPATRSTQEQELSILLQVREPLTMAQGWSTPELGPILTRAMELCRQVGTKQQLYEILNAWRQYHQTRAELVETLHYAKQQLSLAEELAIEGMTEELSESHLGLATVLFYMGELKAAHTHCERGLAYKRLFRMLQRSMPLLWLLGYPDRAQQIITELFTKTENAPHRLAVMHSFAARLECYLHRPTSIRERVEQLLGLATKYALPFWLALGTLMRGWTLVEEGETKLGIAELQRGITALKDAHALQDHTFYLSLLAQAHAKAGDYREALGTLDDAFHFLNMSGERYWQAELVRLQGEFLRAQGASIQEVETCYRQSLDIARRQSAKSLELRASLSLSRLWQEQGNDNEAYTLLAASYSEFTEGFDTADLIEAKVLLQMLSRP